LECEAAVLAAKRWARPHIKAIEAALAEFDRDDERDLCNVSADHRFHLAVARASQNVLLEEAVTVLVGHISAGIDREPKASGGLISVAKHGFLLGARTMQLPLRSAGATRSRRAQRCGITWNMPA
jgi:DNA-binding FadR family transcriptional regulator